MAKVYLDPGHGGTDPGAVKYVREEDVNLTMALACRDHLQANGVTVKMSRTTDKGTSINTMAKEANAWGADLVVSIHNNSGKGDGFEVYHSIVGGKGKVLAANIETEVKKIGQNSRGLKTRKNASGTDYFGMIRLTFAPAVICEGAFVDNVTDVQIIDTTAEQQAFGIAYAKGILKTLGIAEKTETNETVYIVKSGDTLSGIAAKYGTTYQKLAAYNGISNPNVISVGQKIRIPVESQKSDVNISEGVKGKGAAIKLSNCPIYATASSKAIAGRVTGTYYLWDGKDVNGRYRITNAKSRVGVAGQVTGYIDKANV